jgi:hypothetical protein
VPTLAALSLQKTEAQGAMASALCMVTGLLILAALGRCDGGHVTLNGLCALVLFIAALSQARMRIFKPVAIIFFIVFAPLNQFLFWKFYLPALKSVFSIREQLALVPTDTFKSNVASNGFRYSKMLPVSAEYEKLPSVRIGTPLGCDEVLERFLKLTGRFIPDYHLAPYLEIYKKSHLLRKFADLRNMEIILVPASSLQLLDGLNLKLQAKAESEFLTDLLMYPVALQQCNQPFIPEREIMLEIQRHYSQVGMVGQYIIAKRNPESP